MVKNPLKKLLFALSAALAGLSLAPLLLSQYYRNQLPRLDSFQEVQSTGLGEERSLPFYELMSAFPRTDKLAYIPRLEYKKGPPERYLDRMGLVIEDKNKSRERIFYYGRRTEESFSNWVAKKFFPKEQAESRFLLASLETAFQEKAKDPRLAAGLQAYFLKPLMLRLARNFSKNARAIYILDQSGTPAFLFERKRPLEQYLSMDAYFFRRESRYRMEFIADSGRFRVLNPVRIFQKSFLTEKRLDVLEYLAKNLKNIRLGGKEIRKMSLEELQWPLVLLAAKISIDPASLEAYYHFAGLSALLYRSPSMDAFGSEWTDILRNNVLAAAFYAKDIQPEDPKSAEMARLSRTLTRNFE